MLHPLQTRSTPAIIDPMPRPTRQPLARPAPALPAIAAAGLLAALAGCDFLPRHEADPRPRTTRWGEPTGAAPAADRPERTPTADIARQQMAAAMSAAERGEIETAIAEFERIIAQNPTLAPAYLGAGDLYLETGDYAAAEARYARAAQIEPRNFDAQYKHGIALQLMRRTVEAVRAYLRAISIRPNDFDANLSLASAYLDLGEPAQALPYAQRAVQLRSDSGEARINLGAALAALNRHAEAIVEYRQAAELTDLTPDLLLSLADALGHVGNNAEMAATLEQLIRIDPSPEAHERLGAAYFRLRRYEAALDAFRTAVQLDPAHYPAWNGIAVSRLNDYLWSGEQDETARRDALEALRRSLQIEPNQPRIVELLRRFG